MPMRDALIIGAACVLAILMGAWLFFLDEGSAEQARPVEVSLIAEGQQAQEVAERTNYRIRTEAQLQELWAMVYGPGAPALPAVDFSTHEILAVFDGTHTSGGFTVSVTAVEDSALSRTVRIVRTMPTTDCMTASVVTSPFVLVKVPASGLSIVREEEEVARCGA